MKALALNSSPRGSEDSKTAWMLDNLVAGMRQAGAEVELVELRKKKIHYCIGCFTCWTKTPGRCLHKDDMTKELFPKYIASDLVVYATPLYHFTLNAQMKTFVERTLPVLQPFFKMSDSDVTRHPLRHEVPPAVWISVAGFPEDSVFDVLSHYVRFIFKDRLLAEIYRAAAESLFAAGMKPVRMRVAEAVQAAGRELVTDGRVSPQTLAAVKQPLFDSAETFHELGNMFWKTCIGEGVSPKEFREKGMLPRPDSVKSFLLLAKMGFRGEAAADFKAVIQYRFSGLNGGDCFFSIGKGRLQAVEGVAPQADLTISAPFDVWMDILTGKADGQEMFFQQKYTVEGDLNLLLRMRELFGGESE